MKKRILLGVTFLTFVFAFSGILAQAATPDVEGQLWYPDVKSGAKFTWTLTTVTTNTSGTSWDWPWANNVTLTQGDNITMEWTADINETANLGLSGPIDYSDVTTTVGSYECDFAADETYLNFLVVPVYNNGTLGKVESSLNALERFWFNSFILPASGLPNDHTWNLAIDKTTLDEVGADAEAGDEVMAYVTVHDYYDTLETETFAFDLHYDAVSGFLKKFVYPSTKTGELIADDTQPMTLGLDALVIDFTGEDGDPAVWPKPSGAPGFEAPIVVTGLFAFAAIVVIRRRK
jgi:hypothetical protein